MLGRCLYRRGMRPVSWSCSRLNDSSAWTCQAPVDALDRCPPITSERSGGADEDGLSLIASPIAVPALPIATLLIVLDGRTAGGCTPSCPPPGFLEVLCAFLRSPCGGLLFVPRPEVLLLNTSTSCSKGWLPAPVSISRGGEDDELCGMAAAAVNIR